MATPADRKRPLRTRRRVLLAMDVNASPERWSGIAEYAREAGWILESRLFAFRFWRQQADYFGSIRIDGILSRVNEADVELQSLVTGAGVPVVELGIYAEHMHVPRVLPDELAAGRMAADHLLDLGLRRLVFYTHGIDPLGLRRDGFREAAATRGVEIDEWLWQGRQAESEARGRLDWLAERLAALEPPVGVLAGNDAIAADVLDAADHAGLRVPEDVAVMGIDNHPILTELAAVPLTSVDTARQRVGYEAAALLDRMIDGEPSPAEPILVAPAGVVARRSTQMLAVTDPSLIRAVRFIQDHFREPITVADVAASAFLSRRRLQDRFQAAVGHGMATEINRQRLEFAKRLLAETRQKISTIATLAGFGSLQRMNAIFQRELKMTPMAYRRTYHATLGKAKE